eukprot:TRINITY_DN9993_c0_g1_i1.p1 TRINITY_DN9993_c0_g1~~TRINITY_DN9993_c0_g1_i1.p1  ORF type:complete len:374 (+),score=39.07 TRINITY_DN9993_c0_g1_i1:47-1123(+)
MCNRIHFCVFATLSFTVLLPIGLVMFFNGYIPAMNLSNAYLNATCEVIGIGAAVTNCRRYIACYRGVVSVSITSESLPERVNVSSLTNGWSTEADAVVDALNFFGPVGSIRECYYNSLENYTSSDDLKDFAVTNQKPSASSWLLPASVSLILPGIFALALLMWGIKVGIQRIFGWPAQNPEPSAEAAAQSNGGNANTIVVIGAGNSQAVISDRAGGKRDKVKIIDLKKLDLEASESMNSSKVCNICFAHRISVRFEPCGHAFTCSTCGQYFVGRPCGLCRQIVKEVEESEVESSETEEDSSHEEESGENSDASSRESSEEPSDHSSTNDASEESHDDSSTKVSDSDLNSHSASDSEET